MARPLNGTSKTTPAGHFMRGVPVQRGSKARIEYTFLREQPADRWLTQARAAVTAGRPVPQPDERDLVAAARTRRRTGTAFRDIATRWCTERYRTLNRADAERADDVARLIEIMATWMEARDLSIEDMVRDRVLELYLHLRDGAQSGKKIRNVVAAPAGTDPDTLVTMSEALKLPGCPSRSTIKRRADDGTLPVHRDGQRVRYRVSDLFTVASNTSGPGRPVANGVGYSDGYMRQLSSVLESVFRYATDIGIAVPDDRRTLELPLLPKSQRVRTERNVVTLARCGEIAAHLHAVHQLALWILRILGVRISEAYGITTSDVIDFGEGRPGLVFIAKQGGRQFMTFDAHGNPVTTDSADWLKNWASYRKLAIPAPLMDLIRVFTEAVHPGHVLGNRLDPAPARLIPRLTAGAVDSQSGFRTALKNAAAKVGLSVAEDSLEDAFVPRPHDMRRGLASELAWAGADDVWARRTLGHAAGPDVHARVYQLDDPRMRPFREIADTVEAAIMDELGGSVMIPHTTRCTTGNQKVLHARGEAIDAVLAAAGWLVQPTCGEDDLLSAEQFALLAGVSVQVARRWLAEERVPSVVYAPNSQGVQRRVRVADALAHIEALRLRVTVAGLADDLGIGYHRVREFIATRGLELVRMRGRDVVPTETEVAVREHFADVRRREEQYVRLSEAASRLGTTVPVVVHFIRQRLLTRGETVHGGYRTVTRESLDALCTKRSKVVVPSTPVPAPVGELVKWAEACRQLGLTSPQVEKLVDEGRLEVRVVDRRRTVSRRSLVRYLAEADPARLFVGTAG